MNHPDLKFWDENGLTDIKIDKWLKEFNITLEKMKMFLAWSAYDIQNNNVDIDRTAVNFFFGCLKNSGGYSKPINFKSYEEKQNESLQNELDKQTELKEKAETIKNKLDKER